MKQQTKAKASSYHALTPQVESIADMLRSAYHQAIVLQNFAFVHLHGDKRSVAQELYRRVVRVQRYLEIRERRTSQAEINRFIAAL